MLYILPSILTNTPFQSTVKKSTVLVCYGKVKPESIKGYTYVILESLNYTSKQIKTIKAQNSKVFAYISLGEVNINAPYFKVLKENTIGKNENWDSYYLNLKSNKTQETLLSIVDKTLSKGFDGLFLDNIDNFTIYGPQKDQKKDLVNLLKKIKEIYPKKEFLQNAGLDLIPETASYINAIVIESVASNYSFKDKSYNLRDNNEFINQLIRLKSINENSKIPVILIEYADSKKLFNQIVEKIEPSKFEYFIGNIDLQSIPKFK
ncbi:endo alpha-1,4 polygalactosaminidase [Flavobacterium myungsuense]